MPLDWTDLSPVSFNALLLLEQVQLSWFPGWLPEDELAIALQANPVVEWYLRHKCPALNQWLDGVKAAHPGSEQAGPARVRQAELAVLNAMMDLVVYATDPAIYDEQPFLNWDSDELLSLVDFSGLTVIDVGSGTGRLALTAAEKARCVFAVEPVANLRAYLRQKARARGLSNVYAIDGLITDIPFPDSFADVMVGGHVFGDDPEAEYRELSRVTRPDGMIILCSGNSAIDNEAHQCVIEHGFNRGRFTEPKDGGKRKYWLRKDDV